MGSPMACIYIYVFIHMYVYVYIYIYMQYAYIHICGFKGIGNIMGFSLFSGIFLGIQKYICSMVHGAGISTHCHGVNLGKYSIH